MNDKQHIDNFTKKIVKDAALESPSPDFTAKLMVQVTPAVPSQATQYQPIISKKVWGIFACLFLGILFLTYLIPQNAPSTWAPKISFDFSISPVFTYSICSLALVFTLAIPFLKNYLGKQFSL